MRRPQKECDNSSHARARFVSSSHVGLCSTWNLKPARAGLNFASAGLERGVARSRCVNPVSIPDEASCVRHRRDKTVMYLLRGDVRRPVRTVRGDKEWEAN
jgi:hypothetical protein